MIFKHIIHTLLYNTINTMGVCYSYEQKQEIKQKDKIRLKERILREKIQRNLNLKVLKSFWKITEEELRNIPFIEKSINETPFVSPFYNLFFETRIYHLEHKNQQQQEHRYLYNSMIIESNQRKEKQRHKYAEYDGYKHIIERIIEFQKTIGNLQDLKVLLGPINYKILYNTLAYNIHNIHNRNRN